MAKGAHEGARAPDRHHHQESVGRQAEGGGAAERDRRHQDSHGGGRHELRGQRGDQEERREKRPWTRRAGRSENRLGDEPGGSRSLHGESQRQHPGDEHQDFPLDELVGLVHREAPGEDHQEGTRRSPDVDRQQADAYREDHGRHDGRGQECLPLAKRLPHLGAEHQPVRVLRQLGQLRAPAVQKQRIPELKGHRADLDVPVIDATAALYREDHQPVPLPEAEILQGSSADGGARRERDLGEADRVRLEVLQQQGLLSVALEPLDPLEDGEIFLPALQEEPISGPQHRVPLRKQASLAGALNLEHGQVEGGPDTRLIQTSALQPGALRNDDTQQPPLQAVSPARLLASDQPDVGEIGRRPKPLEAFHGRAQQEHVTHLQLRLVEARPLHDAAAVDGQHGGVEPTSKVGVDDVLSENRSSVADGGLQEADRLREELRSGRGLLGG